MCACVCACVCVCVFVCVCVCVCDTLMDLLPAPNTIQEGKGFGFRVQGFLFTDKGSGFRQGNANNAQPFMRK